MAVCFLSAFKQKSLSYSSNDASPWILNGILRDVFDKLLMKGEQQWIYIYKYSWLDLYKL